MKKIITINNDVITLLKVKNDLLKFPSLLAFGSIAQLLVVLNQYLGGVGSNPVTASTFPAFLSAIA